MQRWIHYKLIKILNAIVHYICVYINTPFFSQMGIEIRLLSLTRPEYFYSYFGYHFPFIFKCFPKEVYFYKNLNHYRDRTGCLRVCSVKQVLIILTSARLADKYRCKTRASYYQSTDKWYSFIHMVQDIQNTCIAFYFILFSVALYHELAEPSTYISSKNLTAFLQDLSQVRKTSRQSCIMTAIKIQAWFWLI